jgi:hypothetical protein
MVECERAKLATGVRFSFTAPHEPDLWVETSVCKTGLPSSILGRLSKCALDAQRKGGCLLNSTERVRLPPGALSNVRHTCPHLLAGQGNRSLTPGTRVRIPLGTPRLSLRVPMDHRYGHLPLEQGERVRIPLGTPGRRARAPSLSGARETAPEPTNPPVLAARYHATNVAIEVRLLAGGPLPLSWWLPGASLRSSSPRFDSWQRRRRKYSGVSDGTHVGL